MSNVPVEKKKLLEDMELLRPGDTLEVVKRSDGSFDTIIKLRRNSKEGHTSRDLVDVTEPEKT